MTLRSIRTMKVTEISIALSNTTILSSGMTRVSSIAVRGSHTLAVDFAQHDIDGTDEADDVRDQMTDDQGLQPLQVAE